MPRGVKGSGKAKETTTAKRPYHRKSKIVETAAEALVAPVAAVSTKKARKPYPSAKERIVMADQQIERLTKLNAARTALVRRSIC